LEQALLYTWKSKYAGFVIVVQMGSLHYQNWKLTLFQVQCQIKSKLIQMNKQCAAPVGWVRLESGVFSQMAKKRRKKRPIGLAKPRFFLQQEKFAKKTKFLEVPLINC
jgi:hypothetical protein